MWDLKSPLVLLGVVCILAAIVGGGVKALGAELPLINSWRRQSVLAAFGIALIAIPQMVIRIGEFRVTNVTVSWDGNQYSGCVVRARYTASITTKGSAGEFESRALVVTTYTSPVRTHVDGPGLHVIHGTAENELAAGSHGNYPVIVEILAPQELKSSPSYLHVVDC
ncbi:MAG: hypothetical protein VX424_01455 [Actinomycetota bacterium]|nr:hypothetical protein [Actinomycetota bacterium]